MTTKSAPPASPETTHPPQAASDPAPARRDRTWLGLLVLALLIGAAGYCLRRADATKSEDWLDSRLTFIPSGKFLKPMVMDLDEAAADLLWIRGMIYFADAYLTGKSYKWLGHIIDVVTTLNPRLHQAYEFTGVVLTKEKTELPKTLRILERGIGQFEDDWKLRLYAAMAQVTFDSNYARAAELLRPIAHQEDVPGHIKTMCATFLDKGGNRDLALAFLVDRYLETDNPISREIFIAKILKLFPETEPIPMNVRKRVILKAMHEAQQDPMIEVMAREVLAGYLKGPPLEPKVAKLLELIGEKQ